MDDEAVDGEKIEPLDDHEGDDVTATRNPDAIQKEIEQTRAELAETIDAIADRISPKRAAHRSAAAVKAHVSSVFGTNGSGSGSAPAAVIDASARAADQLDPESRTRAVRQIAADHGGAAYTGTSEFTVSRKLRSDRVLLLLGVLAAGAAVIVLRRSRS